MNSEEINRRFSFGELSFLFEEGGLREIRFRNIEMIRFIGFFVRDENWSTFLNQVTDFRWSKKDNSLSYVVKSTLGENRYLWKCQLTMSVNDLKLKISGCAESEFLSNRIGFVILHPSKFAGNPIRIVHQDDSVTEGFLPEQISAHQPFTDIVGMHWSVAGQEGEIRMSGDIFEMEDQRNWLDASFKTYCTPLKNPFPIKTSKGDRVEQEISCHFSGETNEEIDGFDLEFRDEIKSLPQMGLILNTEPLSHVERRSIDEMRLDHFRLEICTYLEGWKTDFEDKLRQLQFLGKPAEMVLYSDSKSIGEHLDYLILYPELIQNTKYFFVIDMSQDVSEYELMVSAREKLRKLNPDLHFGMGTDFYFTQVNREPPTQQDYDFLKFAVNPQVHAFDSQSILETGQTFFDVGLSALKLSNGKPICISPITFQKRLTPDSADLKGRILPALDRRDDRLHEKIAALWMIKSLIAMTASGVSMATFFETKGHEGVLLNSNTSPVGELFQILGRCKNYNLRLSKSSHPMSFEGMVLEKGDDQVYLFCSYVKDAIDLKMNHAQIHLPFFGIHVYDRYLNVIEQI